MKILKFSSGSEIDIVKCQDCPVLQVMAKGYVCLKLFKEFIPPEVGYPSWCPLPEKDTGLINITL